jgi:hypothetical protein
MYGGQLRHPPGRCGELHSISGQAGFDPERNGQTGFPGVWRSEENYVLPGLDEGQLRQAQHDLFTHAGPVAEVEMPPKILDWDAVYEFRSYVQRDAHPALADFRSRVEDQNRNRILDLGCGDGRHLVFFYRLGAAPIGLDNSRRACGGQDPG